MAKKTDKTRPRKRPSQTTRSGARIPKSRKRAVSRVVGLTVWLQDGVAAPATSPMQWWLLWGAAGMIYLAGFAVLLSGFSTGTIFPPPSGADFANVHLIFRDLF